MAMNALLQQVAGHFVQRGARLFGQPLQHLAGDHTHGGIIHRVNAVGQHNPRAIPCGQLAGILESSF